MEMSSGNARLLEQVAWLRPSGALLRSLSRCKDSKEGRSTVPFAQKYLAKGRFFPSILLHSYLAKGGGVPFRSLSSSRGCSAGAFPSTSREVPPLPCWRFARYLGGGLLATSRSFSSVCLSCFLSVLSLGIGVCFLSGGEVRSIGDLRICKDNKY